MPAARDLSVRPLALGEVIDRAVALTVRHFRPLFVAMLLVQAPALALARVQGAALAEALQALSAPGAAPALLRRLAAGSLAMLAVLLVLQLAATAACAAIVAPSLDPGTVPPSPGRRAAAVGRAVAATAVLLLVAPAAGALPGALLASSPASPALRIGGLA